MRDLIEDQLGASDARGASIIESQRDEGRSGIYDKAQWRAIDRRCEAKMAEPIGVENQDAVGSRSEDGRLGGNVGRRRCTGRIRHSCTWGRERGFVRSPSGTKIPKDPVVNLAVGVLYLAQPVIVGDDYTGPALSIDNLLSGDTRRQFLRRNGQDPVAYQ